VSNLSNRDAELENLAMGNPRQVRLTQVLHFDNAVGVSVTQCFPRVTQAIVVNLCIFSFVAKVVENAERRKGQHKISMKISMKVQGKEP
jgi:hypothetical protein